MGQTFGEGDGGAGDWRSAQEMTTYQVREISSYPGHGKYVQAIRKISCQVKEIRRHENYEIIVIRNRI